ncbi:hypothetical protein FHS72_002011 [Loktanella ponticola]|uniref:Uncharacterized protein n=1 Tax=Yoonia ponticola TaxID=1524255 RepID=A0A7W9BKZ8_9RHOB|nr:hypothetical protein [Yoonia ponticola]MBB5722385.1 hypothetical protein [Yoonia ponticola]
MSPEATILIINIALLGFAYLWAYPSLPVKTWRAIMVRDVAISVAALTLAAALFAGRNITFHMVLFNTNWLVFSIITMMLIETPLFAWFAQKHNLRLNDLDPRDDD